MASGILCHEFANAVKNNNLTHYLGPTMGNRNLEEGAVCKGGAGHKLWMVKIKTKNWLDKVKEYDYNKQITLKP